MSEIAQELMAEVERAEATLRALGEAEVSQDRGPGKWTRKEILGHLIDSAANNHQRFVRAQSADLLVWPGYEQNAWVAVQRHRERPWPELVGLWVALNRHLAHVIEVTAPDKLRTSCVIGGRAPVTLEWLMRDYLRHLRHHLEQLRAG
jgi:hypothetical protein